MNDYMKLLAHAATKYTGQPAVLSPLLDSYCGWENKRSRLSSEPAKHDTRIILSTSGLGSKELKVEFDGCLKVCMQHGDKALAANNFKWSRDCTYKYVINAELAPLLSVYWTSDEFLIIQARDVDCSLAEESEVGRRLQKFKLLPIDVINVLEPAMNVPFMKQIMKVVNKRSSQIFNYVNVATELADKDDVLSLLKCIPLADDRKIDFENLRLDAEEDAAPSSQEDSAAEKSQTDSEDQSPIKKSKMSVKEESRSTRSKSKPKQ